MRQVKAARQSLGRAKAIADQLGNPDLDQIIAYQGGLIETAARDMAKKGETFGPGVACVCGTGRSYRECCGRADFAPVDLPWTFGGRSQDARQLSRELTATGIAPTRLDLFLAEWSQVNDRVAWFKVFPRVGWHEVHELPDMASIQLSAARQAAHNAAKDIESLEWPLSALIMSVCALESFINQVAFFIVEVGKHEDIGLGSLPSEITNVFTFQKNTELTEKWAIVGKFLCGLAWPPSCWNEFLNLVFVRNEFVHFKIIDYQQVIPPPSRPPKIVRCLPANFQLRDAPHSWPFRILTPKLAEWSVSVADKMFKAVRHGYAQRRRTLSSR